MAKLKVGDYVLASKYSDGDVRDPWAIGFVGGLSDPDKGGCYVIDFYGNPVYGGRLRRAKKITPEIGRKLLDNKHRIENMSTTIWKVLKHIDQL